MVTQSNYTELKNAQIAIENLHATIPSIYKKFINITIIKINIKYAEK